MAQTDLYMPTSAVGPYTCIPAHCETAISAAGVGLQRQDAVLLFGVKTVRVAVHLPSLGRCAEFTNVGRPCSMWCRTAGSMSLASFLASFPFNGALLCH